MSDRLEFHDFILSGLETLVESMEKINNNGYGVAFICNEGKLQAVVTDGDVRRYLIKSRNLDIAITAIANFSPRFLNIGESSNAASYMNENRISAVPIVSSNGIVVRIEFDNGQRVYCNTELRVPVVMMAGGKGTRLNPYTSILPKPLIPIGKETIIERIMDEFIQNGCNQFKIIVNYKKELIKAYFSELDLSCHVDFIDENDFMGTGGGLKLLAGKITEPFFMTNCDIIVEGDYHEIIEKHRSSNNIITIVCVRKHTVIPYGTVTINEIGNVSSFTEKPEFTFLTNAGLYVIEPDFLKLIPENQFIHITDIIQICLEQKLKVGIYVIEENSWFDMGQLDALEKMRKRFERNE